MGYLERGHACRGCSLPRRLLVIDDTFVDVIRECLASVRRNAMRLDGMQSDSQDRVRNGPCHPATNRGSVNASQARPRLFARCGIASRETTRRRMISEMLRQSEDILREAGRSSAEAGDLIERMEDGVRSSRTGGEVMIRRLRDPRWNPRAWILVNPGPSRDRVGFRFVHP